MPNRAKVARFMRIAAAAASAIASARCFAVSDSKCKSMKLEQHNVSARHFGESSSHVWISFKAPLHGRWFATSTWYCSKGWGGQNLLLSAWPLCWHALSLTSFGGYWCRFKIWGGSVGIDVLNFLLYSWRVLHNVTAVCCKAFFQVGQVVHGFVRCESSTLQMQGVDAESYVLDDRFKQER